MCVEQFLWYVQIIVYVSWYLATKSRGKWPRLTCPTSSHPAKAPGWGVPHSQRAPLALPVKMEETTPMKKKYAFKFQSTWCETFLFFLFVFHTLKCIMRFANYIGPTLATLLLLTIWPSPPALLVSTLQTVVLHQFILPVILFKSCLAMMVPQHMVPQHVCTWHFLM